MQFKRRLLARVKEQNAEAQSGQCHGPAKSPPGLYQGTQNESKISPPEHYRDARDMSLSPTGLDDAGSCGEEDRKSIQPKVSPAGKVKTFRCKQCSYVALTKSNFWEHTRSHIKAERLLTCPKCTFVTEYKHHFEYHLRNHSGSKPFKCDQCTYSCVNKSMLNSHLKSHSSVYQFSCKDCTYATKYCHSLKLHLRKYSHRPAMVLNPDGSPNPLPIVDVYGTRRGPKQRSKKSNDTCGSARSESSHSPRMGVSPLNLSPNAMILEFGTMPAAQFSFDGIPAATRLTPARNPSPNHRLTIDRLHQLQQLYLKNNNYADYGKHATEPETYQAATPLDLSRTESNRYPSQKCDRDAGLSASKNRRKSVAVRRVSQVPSFYSSERARCATMMNQAIHISSPQMFCSPELLSPSKAQELEAASRDNYYSFDSDERSADSTVFVSDSTRKMDQFEKDSAQARSSPGKLEIRNETPIKEEKMDAVTVKREAADEEMIQTDSNSASPETYCTSSMDENGNDFRCSYCDIIFNKFAMYLIHMGFHDRNDPFTCNLCGHKTKDEMEFYVHVAKFPHK